MYSAAVFTGIMYCVGSTGITYSAAVLQVLCIVLGLSTGITYSAAVLQVLCIVLGL